MSIETMEIMGDAMDEIRECMEHKMDMESMIDCYPTDEEMAWMSSYYGEF